MSFRCLALTALVPLLACSPSAPPVAETGMPRSVSYVAGNLEPMIVDWQPEQRGDLEISMREGLVVVAYDDHGLSLLRDCHVDGSYDFMGMTRRERVVRLESAEDVRANLPLGGLGIAAKIGGELDQGATLDIAMIMVGKLRSTWRKVTPSDLIGQCEHATHVVRGATVGAFAVDRGERSRARAAAEIFGMGGGGGWQKAGLTRVVDGSMADCASADPDSQRAPKQCGALLRVELLAIATSAHGSDSEAALDPGMSDACPRPLVRVDGKCTQASAATENAECTYGEAASCLRACKAENLRSCTKLAMMLAKGEGAPQSHDDAAKLAQIACKHGDSAGCELLGDFEFHGVGVSRDLVAAAKLYLQACRDGEAEACAKVGTQLLTGQGIERDTKAAAEVLARGCKGGSHGACSDLGLLALGGQGFDKELPTAAALFKRSCDGDSAVGCSNYAYMLEFGQGVATNVQHAVSLYEKACGLDSSSCTWFAAMHQLGKGVAQNDKRAVQLYRSSCEGGDVVACAIVHTYLDAEVDVDTERFAAYVNVWKDTCSSGSARDCSGLGVLAMTAGQRDDGHRLLRRGCHLGDEWGCMMDGMAPLQR